MRSCVGQLFLRLLCATPRRERVGKWRTATQSSFNNRYHAPNSAAPVELCDLREEAIVDVLHQPRLRVKLPVIARVQLEPLLPAEHFPPDAAALRACRNGHAAAESWWAAVRGR